MSIVIVDIDGTLSDSRHREPLIETHGWDAFHAASPADAPIETVITLLRHGSHSIWALTGRPEKYRAITNRWLVEHDVPIDLLLMRPDNDYRSAADVKRDLLLFQFQDEATIRDRVVFALEDNAKVVEVLRGLGILTLQVHL